MEKNGQILKWREAERQYLSFKLIFLLLRVNDRLRGFEGTPPVVQFKGIFEISLSEN